MLDDFLLGWLEGFLLPRSASRGTPPEPAALASSPSARSGRLRITYTYANKKPSTHVG